MFVSYNWEFKFDKNDQASVLKIFNIIDYLGNACKAMSSRIRAAVSSVTFDVFHKTSNSLIQQSILSKGHFLFTANNFSITEVNTSGSGDGAGETGYKAIDKEIDQSLQKSFKMSLDIQTQAKEAEALFQEMFLE